MANQQNNKPLSTMAPKAIKLANKFLVNSVKAEAWVSVVIGAGAA